MINCSFHDDDNYKECACNDDDNMNTVNDLAPADVTDGWTPRLETKQISEMWAPVSSCQGYQQQQHHDQTPKSTGLTTMIAEENSPPPHYQMIYF